MMVAEMKSAALLLCCIPFFVAPRAQAADASGVQTVYLLPMANGLDQYLASRLVSSGVFHVTTDPQKADAVFTDRLGEAFERRLEELLPAPAETAAGQANREEGAVRISSISRAKGTVFLVDVHSRAVLWSAYERPRNSTPAELDRTARRIVDALKKPARK
jgi:hypothetical protein